jgi:hypothetical protein
MTPELHGYFAAEKAESVLFVAAGALAIAASIWLVAVASAYRAMAAPLALVALIQLAVGASVYLRTDGQVAALERSLAPGSPTRDAAAQAERARMAKVYSNFQIYKYVEIALFAAGAALALFAGRRDLGFSVGAGLIAQSSLMLLFDLFAERRAERYLEALARLFGSGA